MNDTNLDEQIDEIIEMWDFSPFQDEDSRIGRVHKELKALIADQVARARTTLLRDLNDCGEIHHSVYDYRIEELEQDK